MRLTHGVATDTGRRRSENQDSYLVDFRPAKYPAMPALFVICDGVGGQRAGKTASTLAVEQVFEHFHSSDEKDLARRLIGAADRASAAIFARSEQDPETEGMATTFVAAAFDDERCYIVNAGDSRAYHLANGVMEQVTTDHTLIQEQLSTGLITESQAANSPYRHAVTRYLGRQKEDVGAEAYQAFPLTAGELFLLCSDGLTDMVGDDDIRSICISKSPSEAARALVDLANENGGRDNITVIVIRVDEDHGAEMAQQGEFETARIDARDDETLWGIETVPKV